MALDDDLTAVKAAIETDDKFGAKDAIARLGEANDERAVDLLMEAFEWARLRSGEPAKSALVASPFPDTSPKLAERLERWWEEGDDSNFFSLCVSHGATILGARGDDRPLATLRKLSELAKDDGIVLRGLLQARVALGDSEAQAYLLEQYLHGPGNQGADDYPKRMLGQVPPEVFYDTFASVLRRYQAGETDLARKASRIGHVLTTPVATYVGGVQKLLPLPERDPRWFELGVDIVAERPRPALFGYGRRLLEIEHPERDTRLAAIGWKHAKAEPDPLLEDLPSELAQLHGEKKWSLRRAWGVTWIHAPALKVAQLDQAIAHFGDAVKGLSIQSRPLNAAAFTKFYAWEGLAHFSHLDVGHTPMKAADLGKLIRRKQETHLVHLDISGLRAKKPPFAALAKSEALAGLETLIVSGGGEGDSRDLVIYGDTQLEELLGGGLALEHLSLHGWQVDEALVHLGESELGRGLETLDLSRQSRLNRAVGACLHGMSGGKLRKLVVDGCFQAGAALWNEPGYTELPAFDELHANRSMRPEFYADLATAWFMPQLRVLSLEGTSASNERLDPLLDADASSLEELSLRDLDSIDGDWLERLGHSKLCANLKKLDLGGTDLRTSDVERVPEPLQEAMRAAGWPF